VQVGDLVEITRDAGRGFMGLAGVVTEVRDATVHMPYVVITVTLPGGDRLAGITPSWVKVLNERR